MIDYSKYTFFWRGPLSQWVKSPFVIHGVVYNTAEQYMMQQKAILFNDMVSANLIMQTSNPRRQQELGRAVTGFDEATWNAVARDIVYQGNYGKFTQNVDLHKRLLDTHPTLLVEASPIDRIWGIGLSESDALLIPPEEWPGTNWLGQVLTLLREDLLHGN